MPLWELNISGMTCKGCERTVAQLLAIPGVQVKQVVYPSGIARVVVDTAKVTPQMLREAVNGSQQYRVTAVHPVDDSREPMPQEPINHLIIIGGGSAAFAAAIHAAELGVTVTMINDGLPIGGTCVNVGCVPSKTLLRAAAAWHHCRSTPFQGINCRPGTLNFSRLVQQKDELVQELRQRKYQDVLRHYPGIQYLKGHGKLVDARTVSVDGQIIQGDRIILVTGASPRIPQIPGLPQVPFLTSTTALSLTAVPESLIVLGGRFVALELAQMFQRLGSQVTVLQRSERILPHLSPKISEELTHHLQQEGMSIHTGVGVRHVQGNDQQVVVEWEQDGQLHTLRAHKLLVATGRQPNTSGLGLEAVGIRCKPNGGVLVDEYLQTNVPGIFAAGDVLGEHMLVYTAAYEGKLAAENAIRGPQQVRDYTALPWVLFTDPQVAGVGVDEVMAPAQGIPAERVVLPLTEVPRALAARDTRGFIQLVRNTHTDQLIGGQVVAAEAGEIIMEIALAVRYGLTTAQLADSFHPYLTLSEGIKLAALAFRKDVSQLSCCAT